MPVLGECFRQLNTQAVEFQVVTVGIGLEQAPGRLRCRFTHRDHLKRHDIGAFLFIPEEV